MGSFLDKPACQHLWGQRAYGLLRCTTTDAAVWLQPEAKPAAPVESLEAVRARLKPGTVKRVLFDALEAAGEHGLGIPALVDAVQVTAPSWTECMEI